MSDDWAMLSVRMPRGIWDQWTAAEAKVGAILELDMDPKGKAFKAHRVECLEAIAAMIALMPAGELEAALIGKER